VAAVGTSVCPASLEPQHTAPPREDTAQACASPAASVWRPTKAASAQMPMGKKSARADLVAEGEAVALEEGVPLGEGEPEVVWLAEAEPEGVMLGVSEADAEPEGVMLGVSEADAEPEGVMLSVSEAEGELLAETELAALELAADVMLAEAEDVSLCEKDGVPVDEGEPLAEELQDCGGVAAGDTLGDGARL